MHIWRARVGDCARLGAHGGGGHKDRSRMFHGQCTQWRASMRCTAWRPAQLGGARVTELGRQPVFCRSRASVTASASAPGALGPSLGALRALSAVAGVDVSQICLVPSLSAAPFRCPRSAQAAPGPTQANRIKSPSHILLASRMHDRCLLSAASCFSLHAASVLLVSKPNVVAARGSNRLHSQPPRCLRHLHRHRPCVHSPDRPPHTPHSGALVHRCAAVLGNVCGSLTTTIAV